MGIRNAPLIISLMVTSASSVTLVHTGHGQSGQTRIAEIESRLPDLLVKGDIPGLAIAFIEEGRIVRTAAFGVRNADSTESVTDETIFEAASLTKPIIAVAALRMVDRGELDLDLPLHEYMPYPDIESDDRYRSITARIVLSHTSGFPNWRRNNPLTIKFDPGTRFSYSGEGFVYLQRVMEHIMGKPLHVLVSVEVLEPLAMTRSSLIWEDRFARDLAVPHNEAGRPQSKGKPATANAAWSLHTTAADFARFMVAVWTGDLLRDKTQRAFLSSHSEVEAGVTWGLGVALQHTDRGAAYWHWGHNDGYRSFTITEVNGGFGLVYFTNSDNGMTILDELTRLAFGDQQPSVAWLDYESYDSPTRDAESLEALSEPRGATNQ